MEPTRDTLLRIFELMNTINACDEKLRSLLMSGQAMFVYYSPPRPGGDRGDDRRLLAI